MLCPWRCHRYRHDIALLVHAAGKPALVQRMQSAASQLVPSKVLVHTCTCGQGIAC